MLQTLVPTGLISAAAILVFPFARVPQGTPPMTDHATAEDARQDLVNQRLKEALQDKLREAGFPHPQPHQPTMPSHTIWTLTWDDAVDGSLDETAKACALDLRINNGVMAGEFSGDVLGTARDASFSGDFVEIGGNGVVSFRQDEPGYSVVYAGRANANGVAHGTWYDTRGASGDFTMSVQSGVTETRIEYLHAQ